MNFSGKNKPGETKDEEADNIIDNVQLDDRW